MKSQRRSSVHTSSKQLALLLALAFAGQSSAQEARWRAMALRHLEGTGHFGHFGAKSSSQLEFWFKPDNGSAATVTLNLGFSALEDGVNVATTLLANGQRAYPMDRLLFVGETTDGKGGLALVGYDAGTYKILAQRSYAGRSFSGVGYSIAHKKIYLLDKTSNVILRGTFDPALAALPSTLQAVVTQAQCSGLSEAGASVIYVGCETGADPGLVLGKWPAPMRRGGFWTIWDRPAGPVCVERLADLDYPRISEPEMLLLEGQTQVVVSGKPGLSFDLVSALSGQVMGSGAIGGNGIATTSVVPLALGDIYSVLCHADGKLHGKFATPVKKWGFSETTPSGFQLNSLQPARAFVAEIQPIPSPNSVDMAPDLQMDRPINAPSSAQQWQAWLLVGTEQELQPAGNGQTIIVSNLAIPGTVYWKPTWRRAIGNIALNAPTDPLLAGAVVCYQWMVLEGAELRFSDVQGVILRGAFWDPGFGAFFSSSSTRKKVQPKQNRSPALLGNLATWWVRNKVVPLPSSVRRLLSKRLKRD